ncbi:type II toxin-antitoxin system RelE/ParE family toxin [Rhizobium oryzicola]|uniref:Type II toxin-antitoxin system RelE/ParE family toxin n=1 Tax=Rhizobium oryzicola TaxID=1232668 RepID=A0ABT8SUK3_9HYPH|nr:type II toxin-antitoxin system RelE/ParE family toxin [Rhizobium oryzicola]MDO1582103.1 type II toxin-antitoxin system RelE/ParE family toxin [Rhizobium oryzicola]
MKVTLSPKARDYVRREAKYLYSGNPRAAQQFADDIKRLRQGLSRFPEMGKFNDEIPVPGVLRFVMGAYLVDYEIRGDEILIFAIRHGRERPPRVEIDDDFDLED